MMPEPQDAGHTGRGNRLVEPVLVRPFVAADDLEPRTQVGRVDAHTFDGARRGALATTDLRALEGGTGRARTGEQALAIAEHDLRIGADIDDQHRLVRRLWRFGQQDGGGVGADVTGDARQQIDVGARVQIEVECARRGRHRGFDDERKGCPAELRRVETEQDVMHGRVADEAGLGDLSRIYPRLGRGLGREPPDRLPHHRGRDLGLIGMVLDERNSTDQVLAEADLRVHCSGRGDDLAGRQVAKMGGNGSGSDIDGEPVLTVAETGPNGNDSAALADRDGDLVRALGQGPRQPPQDLELAGQGGQAPAFLQRACQPRMVAPLIVDRGRHQLDVMQFGHGIDLDHAAFPRASARSACGADCPAARR